MLELSQARFSAELAHSTLKVYVAAIAPTTPLLVAFQWANSLLYVSSGGGQGVYAKQWIWMLSYDLESSDLPSPLGIKAHST